MDELHRDLDTKDVKKQVTLCHAFLKGNANQHFNSAHNKATCGGGELLEEQRQSDQWVFSKALQEAGQKCFKCEHPCHQQVDHTRHELHFGGEGELDSDASAERLLSVNSKLPCFTSANRNPSYPHHALADDELVGMCTHALNPSTGRSH
jgi:hypothetical protein